MLQCKPAWGRASFKSLRALGPDICQGVLTRSQKLQFSPLFPVFIKIDFYKNRKRNKVNAFPICFLGHLPGLPNSRGTSFDFLRLLPWFKGVDLRASPQEGSLRGGSETQVGGRGCSGHAKEDPNTLHVKKALSLTNSLQLLLYYFPTHAMTNYLDLTDLKEHKHTILRVLEDSSPKAVLLS